MADTQTYLQAVAAYATCTLTHQLRQAIADFWQVELPDGTLAFWSTTCDALHVAQDTLAPKGQPLLATHRLPDGEPLQCRLSTTVCRDLLSRTLGKSPLDTRFQLTQMTGFERAVLERFAAELLTQLAGPLTGGDYEWQNPGGPSPWLNLAWSWHDAAHNGAYGHLLLTLPLESVRIPQPEPGAAVGSLLDEHQIRADVGLILGETRISVVDLRRLEPGDLIVLEHSNTQQAKLRWNGETEVAVTANGTELEHIEGVNV